MKCPVIPYPSRALRFSAAPVMRSSRLPAARQQPGADMLIMRRTLAAPVETVFRYWTTPAHIARWWSPCPVPAARNHLQVVPGGIYRVCIRTHDGSDHWLRGVYHSVAAPWQLSFSWAWEADTARPASLVIVSFASTGEQTRLLLCHTGLASPQARAAHQAGWEECFDRLRSLLANTDLLLDEVLSC